MSNSFNENSMQEIDFITNMHDGSFGMAFGQDGEETSMNYGLGGNYYGNGNSLVKKQSIISRPYSSL